MSRYTSDGRRISSMTHARRGHECSLCGKVVFGNGGVVSHGRSHVKRGEAVELLKERWIDGRPMHTREFFAPDDPIVDKWLGEGFHVVEEQRLSVCDRQCESQCDGCHDLDNCVPATRQYGDLLLCKACRAKYPAQQPWRLDPETGEYIEL